MKRKILCMLCCLCMLWPAAGLGGQKALSAGARGSDVTRLQQRLTELGLFSGSVDGDYGKLTSAAVQEAQRLLTELAGFDLPQDGNADAQTIALLYDPSAEESLRSLCRGSKGARVQELQNRLIDMKFLSGAADGAFGGATETAVKTFQQNALTWGLLSREPDGVADPTTAAALYQDLSVYGWQAPEYYDFSRPEELNENYLFAQSCILLDAPSGETLFETRADERRYPASTTKIMTLLVSLEQGGLGTVVTIPEEATDVPADSSLTPVVPGESMRKLDLLYGLTIRSGNDAANAVAVIDAGSVEAFVALMNEKAAELGMDQTHFTNPHGYHDEEHYTTARDLSALARAGLTDPVFCQIVTCLSYTMPATEKREALTLRCTHEIFDPASSYYLPYAAGVKSGYTSHAGFCYVGAAQKNGRTLLAAVMGLPSRNRAWLDLKKLFEFGFQQPEP